MAIVHLHHLALTTRQHLAAPTSPRHHAGNAGRALVTQSSDIGARDAMVVLAPIEVHDQGGAGGAESEAREPQLPRTTAAPATAEAATGDANPAVEEKLVWPAGTVPVASPSETPAALRRVTR